MVGQLIPQDRNLLQILLRVHRPAQVGILIRPGVHDAASLTVQTDLGVADFARAEGIQVDIGGPPGNQALQNEVGEVIRLRLKVCHRLRPGVAAAGVGQVVNGLRGVFRVRCGGNLELRIFVWRIPNVQIAGIGDPAVGRILRVVHVGVPCHGALRDEGTSVWSVCYRYLSAVRIYLLVPVVFFQQLVVAERGAAANSRGDRGGDAAHGGNHVVNVAFDIRGQLHPDVGITRCELGGVGVKLGVARAGEGDVHGEEAVGSICPAYVHRAVVGGQAVGLVLIPAILCDGVLGDGQVAHAGGGGRRHVDFHLQVVAPGVPLVDAVLADLENADGELIVDLLAVVQVLQLRGRIDVVELGLETDAHLGLAVRVAVGNQAAVGIQLHPAVVAQVRLTGGAGHVGHVLICGGRITIRVGVPVHLRRLRGVHHAVVELEAHGLVGEHQQVVGSALHHRVGGLGDHAEVGVGVNRSPVHLRLLILDRRVDLGQVDLREDHGEDGHVVAVLGVRGVVHRAVAAQPVAGVVGEVVDAEEVGPGALELVAGGGDGDQNLARAIVGGGHDRLGEVDGPVGGGVIGIGPGFKDHVAGTHALGALVEVDAVGQRIPQVLLGLLLVRSGHGSLVEGKEVLGHGAVGVGLDVLAELKDDGIIHPGVLGQQLDDGPGAVGGADGHLAHSEGVVARLILGHIVEVVGLLRLQAGDVEVPVPGGAGADAAAGQRALAGGHLQLGFRAVQRGSAGLAVGGTGVGLALRHHGPEDGSVLAEAEGDGHRGIRSLAGQGTHDEGGGRLVSGGEGQGYNGGTVGPVGVGEPEVDSVVRLLLQHPVVDAEGTLHVLVHILHAVAQRAGDRAGLQLIDRGGLGRARQQDIIELAVLCGHDHGHAVPAGDLGHMGISLGEGGNRVVGGCKGDHLGGAALAPVVHQHGGQVVGPVGSQPGDAGGDLLISLGGEDVSAAQGDAAVGGGLDELVLAHGAVGDGADRPVDGAPLIGGEEGLDGGGGDVGGLGIPGEDQGIHGGLLGGHGVHLHAVDGGGDAGPDHDLVRQHGHVGAGGVDNQLLNVALAGDGGAGVQVELLDHSAPVNDHRGAHGGLVHRQLGHGALGGLDLRVGGAVDDLPDPAGQIQLDGLPVLGLLALGVGLPLQGDVLQSHAVGGVVLDVGAGAHGSVADVGDTVGPDCNIVVLEVVHQQLVGGDVAQQDAGLAALALTAAAGNDAAQDGDVLQLNISLSHAAGDIQVPADHGIPQRDAGRGNGDVAEHAAQRVVPRLLEGGADSAGDQRGHLAPGDVLLGPEGAVVIAGNQVVLQGGLDGPPAPVADVAGVGEVQNLPRGLLEHHIAPQDGGRRLPGEGVVGGGGGGGGAVDVAGVVGDTHIVIEPIPLAHILKGGHADLVIAVGPVDDGHKVCPCQGLVGAPCLVGADKAPLQQLAEVGIRPVGRGRLPAGEAGNQPQQEDKGQQEG